MKKTGLVIAAASLLLLLCSCASSDRMVRLSPMNTGHVIPKINLDKKLVNIWPFFYQDDQFTSALWPMIDFDNHGFAVRPFYNKEGDYQSVLFPLSSWNAVTGKGHALNTIWGPDRLLVIPFFAKGHDFFSILFPLTAFAPNVKWVFPAYWTTSGAFGVFPLVYYSPGSYFSLLFPFSRFTQNESWILNTYWGQGDFVFFPVLASVDDFKHFLNIYWRHTKEDGLEDYGFFPLFHHEPGFRQWLFPLYFYQTGDDKETLLTPLFGYSATPEKMTMLNILLAAYYYNEEANGNNVRIICWPLIYHEQENEREKSHILPFYSYDTRWPAVVNWTIDEPISNGTRSIFNVLGPFGYQHTRRSYNTDSFSAFNRVPSGTAKTNIAKIKEDDNVTLGLFSWGTETYLTWKPEHAALLSELTALWREHLPVDEKIAEILRRYPDIPADASRDEIMTTLREKYTTETESSYRQFTPFYRYRSYRDNYHWSVLFYLLGSGYRDRDQDTAGLRINPFFACKKAPEAFELSVLWPVYQYRSQADNYRWNILFFLARGEKQGADSDFQILRYLYRHTIEGDSEQYSIFPFISYRRNKEKKQFSFLWRLFNYEQEGDRTSGHIFFIPW